MKRGKESGEELPAEKRGILGGKLMRVGKRGGQTTPIAPFWRPKELTLLEDFISSDFNFGDTPFRVPCVSVRKLGATLWELYQYNLPVGEMHSGVGFLPPRLRRVHHQHRREQIYADDDPSPIAPEMPGSSSSLRRLVAASLMQHHHHRSIDHRSNNNPAVQPVSPASYGSSMEIAPYNPAIAPTSSIEFKGRNGDTSFSLKTSTELLKVLNRIWSLEEQHVTNTALIKALKKDLEHSRSCIKELVRTQHADRREMDEIMKQITEEKSLRKNKEQDKINVAIESMRSELEDERKLRKRSESLHRKLARELYDIKTTLASVSNDLDTETQSRNLLEDLCDEFAWGVKDYEKELHDLRRVSENNWSERVDQDKLILHLSESWLDERIEMKMQNGEKKSASDKLRPEIEAFLDAKRNGENKVYRKDRRSSLESIPLNMVVSAPRDEKDGEDSEGSDSNCFELEKTGESEIKPIENEFQKNNYDETLKQKQVKKKLAFSERETGQKSSLQVKFEEHMAEEIINAKGSSIGNSISQKFEKCEMIKESGSERKNEDEGITTGLNSNHMIDNLIRNHYLFSESHDKDYGVSSSSSSIWRSHPSPVRKWSDKLPSHDLDVSELSSKLPLDLKQNILKSKLLEARTRGQRSRSRPKASIIPSRNE